MTGGYRAAPPVTHSLRGDIAEVWQNGSQLGLLYQFTIHGSNGKWEGDALKYRLERAPAGEVMLRWWGKGQGWVVEFVGYGHIASEVEADSELHLQAVRLKGTRLEVA